jgi:hypothetical protein
VLNPLSPWHRTDRPSAATLHHTPAEPVFPQAVDCAEVRAIDDLSRLLVRLSCMAVATPAKVMMDPSAPYATRVRAADTTLARLLPLRKLAVFEGRVCALEAQAGTDEGLHS